MTDIKTKITDFAKKEDEAVKAWLGTNWVPFALGTAFGLLVEFVLHHL